MQIVRAQLDETVANADSFSLTRPDGFQEREDLEGHSRPCAKQQSSISKMTIELT